MSFILRLILLSITLLASYSQAESRLQNIATRGFIGTGDNVLIGGLVVTGTQDKTILIRAKGPSLAAVGVPRVLADPEMVLFSGASVIDSNNNWQDHGNAALIPVNLQPSDANESAILITLAPGAYTAIVLGVGGTEGIGLVEVFELEDTGETRIINIATRGFIGTGDDVMIGGLVVQGSSNRHLIIRAKGPSLSDIGVSGAISDPQLVLFSGADIIDSNDNWRDHHRAGEIPRDLQPTNDLESVVFTELVPGAYTAIVLGVGDSTGIGIVEVFEAEAATANQRFQATISESIIQNKCITCHTVSGVATATPLLFSRSTTANHEELNLQAFQNYLQISEGQVQRILDKSSGAIAHTGGVQIAAGSQEFIHFQNFLNLLDTETPVLVPSQRALVASNAEEQYFLDQIDVRVLDEQCLTCHIPNGLAGATRLIFTPHGEENYQALNIQVFKDFLANIEDAEELILNKIQGVGHGGGTIFSSLTDEYRGLSIFLDLLDGGTGDGIDVNEADQFWNGLTLSPNRKTLRTAALVFAGRLPTNEEYSEAELGEVQLRASIRGMLEGASFHEFIIRGANDRLLTDALLNGLPFDFADINFPYYSIIAQEQYEFFSTNPISNESEFREKEQLPWYYGLARSTLELIAYVAENDLPYTEILTADYMMMNYKLGQVMRSGIDFGNSDQFKFLPGKNKGQILSDDSLVSEFFVAIGNRIDSHGDFVDYPHAGILNSPAFLNRYPTTDTNRNRARARWTYYHFLGVDIEKSASRTTNPVALADKNNPTLRNPACTVCHETMDPVAGAFANYGNEGWYRSSYGGLDSLPGEYKSPQPVNGEERETPYQLGDVWFRDMRDPGLGQEKSPDPDRALAWLAEEITQDPRFASAAVSFWWQAVMGVKPLEAPETATDSGFIERLNAFSQQQFQINQLGKDFAAGFNGGKAFNLKDLLAEMALTNWFRGERLSPEDQSIREIEFASIGQGRLLTPAELESKTSHLLGFLWGEQNPNIYSPRGFSSKMIDQYRIYYGGIDSVGITDRAREVTAIMSNVVAKQAYELSCPATSIDFAKDDADRRLFKGITRSITPITQATVDFIAPGDSYANRTTVSTEHLIDPGSFKFKINYNNAAFDSELEEGRQLYISSINIKRNGDLVRTILGNDFPDQAGFVISETVTDEGNRFVDGNRHFVSDNFFVYVIYGGNGNIQIDLPVSESGTYTFDLEVWAVQLPDKVQGEFTFSIESIDPFQDSVGSNLIKNKIIELHSLFLGEELSLDSVELEASYQFLVETWQARMLLNDTEQISAYPREQCFHPDFSPDWTEEFQRLRNSDPQRMMGTWVAFLAFLMSDYEYIHE
jgi:hypothetical protein